MQLMELLGCAVVYRIHFEFLVVQRREPDFFMPSSLDSPASVVSGLSLCLAFLFSEIVTLSAFSPVGTEITS